MTRKLFTNVRIIDATGSAPFPGQVLVEGATIAALWHADQQAVVGDAQIHDGKGCTLMPGLIEPHSHLTFTNYLRSVDMGFIPTEEHMLITVRNARTMLRMGYTSCFSAASAKPRLDIVLRNAIEAGEFPGPRTLAASPELTVTAGLGDVRLGHIHRENFAVVLDGAHAFRQYARLMCREGVDTLKMNISGDAGTPASPSNTTVMTEQEIAAVSEVAHAHGKRLAAHTRSALSVKLALRHGVDVLYHATLIDGEVMDLLESQRERIFVAPTLGNLYATLHEASAFGVTFSAAQTRNLEYELATGLENMKALKKRGVRVLPGGDYGVAWCPIGATARDLEHFVKLLDFTPMEAIVAATRSGAEIMGMSDHIGRIAPGYLADLILVQGDPSKNIELLQRQENILTVMKGGQVQSA